MHRLDIDPWFIRRAKKARAGRRHAHEHIDPPRTALIVIDMQHYFCLETMPAFVPYAQNIVPNINRLAEALRAAGGRVIWVQTEHPEDPDDWPNRREATSTEGWQRRRRLLARDGEGFPLFEGCRTEPEDGFVHKTRYSAFIPHPSELDLLLRRCNIDTLLISGVSTSTCCESTARDASMWDYRTIMVSDANADQTDHLHIHALGKFLEMFGDVQSVAELLQKLSAASLTGTSPH